MLNIVNQGIISYLHTFSTVEFLGKLHRQNVINIISTVEVEVALCKFYYFVIIGENWESSRVLSTVISSHERNACDIQAQFSSKQPSQTTLDERARFILSFSNDWIGRKVITDKRV